MTAEAIRWLGYGAAAGFLLCGLSLSLLVFAECLFTRGHD